MNILLHIIVVNPEQVVFMLVLLAEQCKYEFDIYWKYMDLLACWLKAGSDGMGDINEKQLYKFRIRNGSL